MTTSFERSTFIPLLFMLLACSGPVLAQSDETASGLQRHFEQHVRPLLSTKCIECHGAEKQEGGLRLDTLSGAMEGGDSGAAIVAGKPGESLLLEALRYESFEMPPSGQLDDESIEHVEWWIEQGAHWPEHTTPLRAGFEVSDADRHWWAFQPVKTPTVPAIEDDEWSTNDVDRFVLATMGEHNLTPAPQADRATLVRRLYFDLLGVPPTPDEIDAFLLDESPVAWEKLVDQLLDDPRYGEHWARFWLDIVRYSESDGWNQDAYRPHIWRYRDYVVNAFNSDKPYNEFVREQLAGDEIGEDNPEHLAAAGFLRLGIYEYNQRDARGHWNDIMNEMTDVAGDVFLGLSMACARCHNHKFDPIPQADYFKLRAFFEPIVWRDDLVAATQAEKDAYAEKQAAYDQTVAHIQSKIDALIEPYYASKWESTVDKFPLDIQACFHMPVEDRTSWQHQMSYLVERQFLEEGGGPLKEMTKEHKAEHEALLKELEAFKAHKPDALPALMTATDFPGLASPTTIPGSGTRDSIAHGYLEVMASNDLLPTADSERRSKDSSGRRTQLANWIGSGDNPLTMRVIVNRVWQQHFGRGLVETPSDFGTQGSLPSHPALLDYLTSEFVSEGFRLKSLHRRILLSSTWQQSASHPDASVLQASDPEEKFLWRAPVRRLSAEQIRDAMLVASGELQATIGGPSVEEKQPRRSLYLKSFRNKNDTFLHGFDMANGLKSVPVRDATTTPTQALLLINGDYAIGRAKKMAKELAELRPMEAVVTAFRRTWGRRPSQDEFESAANFLQIQSGEDALPLEQDQLADLCHILFNSNQFLYVE